MIGFIGTSFRLQSITTAHNQWLSTTSSIPYWTTSVFSSTVRQTNHTLNCLEWRLSDESLLRINYDSSITFRRPEYRSPSQTVPLLFFVLSVATKRSNPGPIVDCVTSRMCLQKRCLASGHIPSQYYFIYLLTTFLYKLYVRNGACSRY
jgi:hypothetical protein